MLYFKTMVAAWTVGVLALGGAAVGAGATIASNWMTSRTQLRLAAEERRERDRLAADERQERVRLAADQRRERADQLRADVCAEYLVAADTFMDDARELVARLEAKLAAPQLEGFYDKYCESWERLQRKCAPVVIAGPQELATRAETLKFSLGDLADACEDWYTAQSKGATRGKYKSVTEAQSAARAARAVFISTAYRLAQWESSANNGSGTASHHSLASAPPSLPFVCD